MIRFLGLWSLLLLIEFVIAVPMIRFVTHDIDLRYDMFLISLFSPAMGAVLLLAFLPPLRDADRPALAPAMRQRSVAILTILLTIVVAVVATLRVSRVAPAAAFDWLRGGFALAAAAIFAIGWWRTAAPGCPDSGGPRSSTLLFGVLGATSGRLQIFADRVFRTQPIVFRWIVFYGALSIAVVVAMTVTIRMMRRSAPEAAAVLEWALAPAFLAGLIVLGNMFWRPSLTPGWDLLANVLGAAAMALVLIASAAYYRCSVA